jgi:hypothetical protein
MIENRGLNCGLNADESPASVELSPAIEAALAQLAESSRITS